MNMSMTRIAGWSAILRIAVVIIGVVLGVLLLVARQPVEVVGASFGILEILLTFPLIYALARLLYPHEGSRAWFQAALGGLGYGGNLVIRVMFLTHTISIQAATTPQFYFVIFMCGWLLWVNWQLWRTALVRGALPWIGIAYALAYLLAQVSAELGSILRVFAVVAVIGQIIWYIWLGVLLIRGKIILQPSYTAEATST
jgi:hypothetical protein